MKLYIVIYILGQVIGQAGPVPFGMDKCERKAIEILEEFKKKPLDGTKTEDIKVVCEYKNEK